MIATVDCSGITAKPPERVMPISSRPSRRQTFSCSAPRGGEIRGQALGGPHPEPWDVVLLGDFARGAEPVHQFGHLGADGYALEGDDVAFPRGERPVEVGEADAG